MQKLATPLLLAGLIAGVSGLAAAEDPALAVGASASVSASADAATLAAALDPDAHFKGQTGGTFGKNVTEVLLPKSKRVIVAGFRVIFLEGNAVSAQVRASYLPGRDTSGAKASLSLKLVGVDDATLQAITDQAYKTFIEQLKASGREVVTAADLPDFNAKMETVQTPYRAEVGAQKGVAFAPTGTPMWWTYADPGWTNQGPFKQANYRALAPLSTEKQGIVIAPMIVVDFARLSSSGNRSGLTSNSAEVGSALEMGVRGFHTPMLLVDGSQREEGAVSLTAGFNTNQAFGTITEVAQEDNKGAKGVADMLGGLMGLANAGGAARSKSEQEAKTDNTQYSAAATLVLNQATGSFASWFRKYPATN